MSLLSGTLRDMPERICKEIVLILIAIGTATCLSLPVLLEEHNRKVGNTHDDSQGLNL